MENKDEQLTTGEIQREAITKELRDMLREELAKQNVPVVDQVAAQPLTTLHQPKTVPLAIPVGSEPRLTAATPPGVELSALLAPTPDKPIVIAGPAPVPSKVSAPKAAPAKSGRGRLIAMTAAIGVLAVAATGGALWMSAKRNTSAVSVARADTPRPPAPAESVVSLPVGARAAPPVAAAPTDPAPAAAPAEPAAPKAKAETIDPAAKAEAPKAKIAAAAPAEAKAKPTPAKEDPKAKPVAKAADEPAKPAAPAPKPAPAGVDAILQQQLNNTLP